MIEGCRTRIASQASVLLLPALVSGASAGEPSPTFTYAVSPCPASIEARTGRSWERESGVLIITAANPRPDVGVVGWILSMTAEGGEITEITTQGTLATPSPMTPRACGCPGSMASSARRQE